MILDIIVQLVTRFILQAQSKSKTRQQFTLSIVHFYVFRAAKFSNRRFSDENLIKLTFPIWRPCICMYIKLSAKYPIQ